MNGANLGKEVVLDLGGDSKLPILRQVLLEHSQLLGNDMKVGGGRRGQEQSNSDGAVASRLAATEKLSRR